MNKCIGSFWNAVIGLVHIIDKITGRVDTDEFKKNKYYLYKKLIGKNSIQLSSHKLNNSYLLEGFLFSKEGVSFK